MSAIKKVWITEHDVGLVALSMESVHVIEKFRRIHMREMEFPEVPSKNNPLRHTIVVSLLDDEDLKKIMVTIAKHLGYGLEGVE